MNTYIYPYEYIYTSYCCSGWYPNRAYLRFQRRSCRRSSLLSSLSCSLLVPSSFCTDVFDVEATPINCRPPLPVMYITANNIHAAAQSAAVTAAVPVSNSNSR